MVIPAGPKGKRKGNASNLQLKPSFLSPSSDDLQWVLLDLSVIIFASPEQFYGRKSQLKCLVNSPSVVAVALSQKVLLRTLSFQKNLVSL